MMRNEIIRVKIISKSILQSATILCVNQVLNQFNLKSLTTEEMLTYANGGTEITLDSKPPCFEIFGLNKEIFDRISKIESQELYFDWGCDFFMWHFSVIALISYILAPCHRGDYSDYIFMFVMLSIFYPFTIYIPIMFEMIRIAMLRFFIRFEAEYPSYKLYIETLELYKSTIEHLKYLKEQKRIAEFRKEQNYWNKFIGKGKAFEDEIAKIFEYKGYTVKKTPCSGDHGIDLFLVSPSGEKCIVQCKAHAKAVSEQTAQRLLGSLHSNYANGATRAILVSIMGFTKPCIAFMEHNSIEYLSLNELIKY